MCRTYLLYFLFFASGSLLAQAPKYDSLKTLLAAEKADTSRAKLSNQLGNLYRTTGKLKEARQYFKEAFTLSERSGYKKGLGDAYHNLGIIFWQESNNPEALQLFNAALKIRKELGSKKDIAATLNNLGGIASNMGNYPEAIRLYLEALKMFESFGFQQGIAYAYTNLGVIYRYQRDYPQSIKNYYKALDILKKLGDREAEASTHYNLAVAYRQSGEIAKEKKDPGAAGLTQKASEEFLTAQKIFVELDDQTGVADVYQSLGNLYNDIGQHEKVMPSYEAALALYKEQDDRMGMGTSLSNISAEYERTGNFAKAEECALKSLALRKEIGDLEGIKNSELSLSELYEHWGRPKEALEHYKLHIAARDSLANEENTKKQVQSEMQYEFDKKEEAARLDQEKKDALATADARRQKIILFAISGFGVLVLGFALFAWRSYLHKQKANLEITHQKELIEEKQKEILDSIHYAKRIQRSLLTSERYISRHLKRHTGS